MTGYRDWFDRASRDCPTGLSAGGRARRAAIKEDLLRAVDRRRRRRSAATATAVLAAGVLVGVLCWQWFPAGGADLRGAVVGRRLQHVAFREVRNDPGVLERYALPPAPLSPDSWIDDAELLRLLRDADRPSGLVRIGDRVFLTAPVTDVEIAD